MNQKIKASLAFLAAASVLVTPQTASAAGFYLSEVGTPHSLGTAGVANPTNVIGADSSWTNPAGMTGLDSSQMIAGTQVALPEVKFESSILATRGGGDGGNAGEVAVIPSFFYVNKFSDDLRLGFSVTAPIGGGIDYGDNFVGRYVAQKATLAGLAVSPSIAYQLNDKFSIGAGVSFVYTIFEQDIAMNPAVIPTVNGADGKLKIEDATDWGYQPFVGMTWQMSDRALLGVVYRAEMDVELDGDVKTRNLPGFIAVDSIDVDWDNPQWLEAGLKYQLNDKNHLFLNAGWQEWSAFSSNSLAFSGGALSPDITLDRKWDNTWHAGVAFTHHENNRGTSIGFSYDSSPVEDKHRTFDLPMEEYYKVSFSYFWDTDKHLGYSIGGTAYLFGDAEIDQTAQGVRAAGEFDTNYLLFLGGAVRYVF
jgi:long-chain fatty acid transport protein